MYSFTSSLPFEGAILIGLFGYVFTNLDNLVVLCAMIAGRDAARAWRLGALSLFVAGILIIVLSLLGAEIADELPVEHLRWLGFVPLTLGVTELMRSYRPVVSPNEAVDHAPGLLALVSVLMANGADTLAVMIPILTESPNLVRTATVFGFFCGIAVVALVVRPVLRSARLRRFVDRFGARFGAIVMICAGLYVLLDTPTDMV